MNIVFNLQYDIKGQYVRWPLESQELALDGKTVTVPQGQYFVRDHNDEYALITFMLSSNYPSAKHGYIVELSDLKAAGVSVHRTSEE